MRGVGNPLLKIIKTTTKQNNFYGQLNFYLTPFVLFNSILIWLDRI